MMRVGWWWLLPLVLVGACRKSSTDELSETADPSVKFRDRPARDGSAEVDPVERVRISYEEALVLEDSAEQQRVFAEVAWDAIELDPELAQEAFARLETGTEASKRLIGHFVMRLADEDPVAAVEWARGLEDPAERSEGLGRAAVVIANQEPQLAGDLVVNEMEPGRSRDRSAVQVVQRWSQSNPEAALSWAESLDSRPARQAGMSEAVGRWMSRDESAVVSWLVAVETEQARAEAVLAVADALGRMPDEESQRIIGLLDGELRERVEARVEHGLER